jgi:V/A-type H+-transporting ATPase subunit D
MKITIYPTRMELQKTKRRLFMAQRGHKLLKDKLDGLIKEFMDLIKKRMTIKREVSQKTKEAVESMIIASSVMSMEFMEEALMSSKQKLTINADYKNIMGIVVPSYKAEVSRDFFSYGFAFTSGDLDLALIKYYEVIPKLLELASIDKSLELMAADIEKTRRRVNALEYIFIPELESIIKTIGMKLVEMERSAKVSILKIKETIRGGR